MPSCKVKRTIMGRLPLGADLYESLVEIVQRENIRLGRIHGLGGTTHAVVAYYDQQEKEYKSMEFPGGMEILNLHGNVSLRDGKPFVHAHIVLGDRHGHAVGGHLMPGTKLWLGEIFIDELEGEDLIREKDERTGLFAWTSGNLT
jgi:predicted DNA-binding protein with PD1-like motif